MKPIKACVSVMFALGLSACGSMEAPSRSGMDLQPGLALGAPVAETGVAVATEANGPVVLVPQYTVASVTVKVPRELKVSEANTFLPLADIVWRGEPRGDRHAQVLAIYQEAMARGTAGMDSGPEVLVEVEVTRFHALTEKTRYTVGGNHALRFLLTVRDAATGAIIDGPREVIADIRASGGAAAIAEDQAGLTQRVVVVDRLAEVIRRELAAQISGPAAEDMLSALEVTIVPGQDGVGQPVTGQDVAGL